MENKVIEKIQKLLALSSNNTSEEEAISAALKAQKLMAMHDIQMADIEDTLTKEEAIKVEEYETGPGMAWKYQLANIVANNFRCKTFHYGKKHFCFYGCETDAKIAKQVFGFLYKIGHKLANKEVYRKSKIGGVAGIYNSFCQGFLSGIGTELGKQCKALMIVISAKVKEEYFRYSAEFKKSDNKPLVTRETFDRTCYESGEAAGRKAIQEGVAQKSIEE